MRKFQITPSDITPELAVELVRDEAQLSLSAVSEKRIKTCRDYLDRKLKNNPDPVYGINTGFGALYNKTISPVDLEKLQENLVRSHACGTGNEVPPEIVRLMMLLKIHALSKGYSGVQLSTVWQLIELFNAGVTPVVYQLGSLGASGDLAPLAHMSLALIGEGEVVQKGKRIKAAAALKSLGLAPLKFKPKEALALLNGTQFMSAYACMCVYEAGRIAGLADEISALSLDAFDGRPEPFSELLQEIRPHPGQISVAGNMRRLLKGSQITGKEKKHVQDPYSFRCIPQVHGATRDVLTHSEHILRTEINSVTDNPTIFPEADKILSGGNFHGQPLALMLDHLAIAVAELGSISERRTFLLISGQRGLPPFLVHNPGLNSGLMIPQYTAASIVSKNKQLCTPASVDSITSSNGQEDHVSMGANAATKCYEVVKNVMRVLSIEMLSAAQAIEFRRPLRTSTLLENQLREFRKTVPFIKEDVIVGDWMRRSEEYLQKRLA
ncbi:MAG: histidine ammonia-lyase [Bacteroidia bacterium]|nr:histidine ammonia-lyase [Bacteroidia bacterium]